MTAVDRAAVETTAAIDTAVSGGAPVVLLHALPLDSSMWRAQAGALGALGHTVLAVDQRGFGRTPLGASAAPPSLDAVADDLADTLDRLGIDRAVLAGCSMGGYTAMAFLRRHPGRTSGLALFSTRAEADTPEAAARRRAFAGLMIGDEAARDRVVEATTPALLGATTRDVRPATTAEVLAVARAADPASVAWAQQAIAARPDSLDVLRATDVPALAVVGEEDELVAVEEARTMADALPRGRLVTLPGVGHLPPLEAPDRTVQLLAGLLDDVAATALAAKEGR
ncbi:alpha/beta fold hydrolase [Streptomyces sp. NPDC059568]|uniref:alpha/beta fold hydrolase n=1 Tax=Streptomyces sp. NPDC059568 TaxID=3346868 RepID=UPI0036736B04